jgi:hypothetical protein
MNPPIQFDRPLFVRSRHRPITWKGRSWKFQEHFPWAEIGVPEKTVIILYNNDQLYHDENLEVANKVGDRLSEMSRWQLDSLVRLVNAEVKERTGSKAEFDKKKCKFSAVDDKQRGLIRQWLRANPWASEAFYTYRDQVLEKATEAT